MERLNNKYLKIDAPFYIRIDEQYSLYSVLVFEQNPNFTADHWDLAIYIEVNDANERSMTYNKGITINLFSYLDVPDNVIKINGETFIEYNKENKQLIKKAISKKLPEILDLSNYYNENVVDEIKW